MASKRLVGQVWVEIVEVRFAFSGKISHLGKNTGELVKKGELLASLDKKLLQSELDRQLADYEKQRAEFEIFIRKNTGEDDITKFQKSSQQADLNSAVKKVEIAKMHLDQADLFSPVTGQILDDGGNVPGLYVTPSSGVFKIANHNRLRLRFEIEHAEVNYFRTPQETKYGFTLPPYPTIKLDKFIVEIAPKDTESLVLGQEVAISLPLQKQKRPAKS